jgi:hypothetical protein
VSAFLYADEADNQEAVAAGYEAFHTLQQLGPSGREKYLEEVRKYGPGLSFTIECFDEPTSQGRSFSHGSCREERDTVMDDSIADNNHLQAQGIHSQFSTSLTFVL